MANTPEEKLFQPRLEDKSTETAENTNYQDRKLFQPWVEDKSTETAEDTNHQDRKLFQPWVKEESTETVKDTVKGDVSLLSEKNRTHHKDNSSTENEKQKDPSNWPTNAECSEKEHEIETKTFFSLSKNTETGRSVCENIGCKQSTSSHNYCEKNVECHILETSSSLSKPSTSNAAATTEHVTCISSAYKINSESNISRQPLDKYRTINEIKFPDGYLHTDTKKCDIRREKFVNRERLIKHVRTPTEDKPQCPVCSKICKGKNNLNIHMRIHTGQRTHLCTVCNKTFAQKSHLTSHMSTHTDLKPHQCEECDRKFEHKHVLIRHILTHTGQKPHPCTECDKSFSQKSNLKTHMRTHTNEKPYKCPECDMACRTKGNLNNHRKTHTKWMWQTWR